MQDPIVESVEGWADQLKMAADPSRLRILLEIDAGKVSVGAITAAIGSNQPAVSANLKLLKLTGLASSTRDGRQMLYSLTARGKRLLAAVLSLA